MADIFSKRKRSAVMSAIRSRGNRDTELRLIAVFRAQGIIRLRQDFGGQAGWRRGASLRSQVARGKLKMKFTVRPDFVFPRLKLAVFVDGCFWHGWPQHATQPKANAGFWRKKLAGNRTRDRLVNRTLRVEGWRVLRIWEHELTKQNERRLRARLRRVLPT
jgi:DNA mismatch endonuclease (patch repair protein)